LLKCYSSSERAIVLAQRMLLPLISGNVVWVSLSEQMTVSKLETIRTLSSSVMAIPRCHHHHQT
jgi:hypothetical protein